MKNFSKQNKDSGRNIDFYNTDLKSALSEEEEGHYLIIVADRKKAVLFLFKNGKVETRRNIMDPGVRKYTKINSGELYGRSTKLAHHIDNQLHRHLQLILKEANNLITEKHINGVFIGGHKPLFAEVVKELHPDLQKKLRGEFITELNIPDDELANHCKSMLDEYIKR